MHTYTCKYTQKRNKYIGVDVKKAEPLRTMVPIENEVISLEPGAALKDSIGIP